MPIQDVIAALMDGQKRREWLDRQDERLTGAAKHYLGPAYAPVEGAGRILAMLSPAQDVVDMQQAGTDLMQSRGALPIMQNLGSLGATSLGMFLGPAAKIADHAALEVAQKLADEGADARRIWDETGWFKGADGKWRFEIDDSGIDTDYSGALADVRADGGNTVPLGGAMTHRELFKAYPGIDDADVMFWPRGKIGSAHGAYSGDRDVVSLADDLSEWDARSFMLHEGQHAVQNREGFVGGGAPRDFSTPTREVVAQTDAEAKRLYGELRQVNPELPDWYDAPDAARHEFRSRARDSLYDRLAGEVEARNVQTRRDWPMSKRREIPPWETEDVPRMNQIIRFR